MRNGFMNPFPLLEVSDQQLPLLRQIVLAESGWLAGKDLVGNNVCY